MADSEMKLNSLSRFSKKSPNLVLEEYSHCEVPAGCGGVVLRWRNPDEPIPMSLEFGYVNGQRDRIALDGKDTGSQSKIPVIFGVHVLTIVLTEVKSEFACILLAADLDPEYVRVLQPEGDTQIRSLPDGTWRYALTPPPDDWQQPDFDDTAWPPMIEKAIASDKSGDSLSTWTQEIMKQGARGLGVPKAALLAGRLGVRIKTKPDTVTVYVRKKFRVLKRGEE